MIIKEYNDLTPHEKEQMQEIWVEVLNTFCHADEDGCRPCDYGCPCDICHYDYDLQCEYAKTLVARGVPLTPHEADYLEETA